MVGTVPLYKEIIKKLKEDKKRYYAGDNISEYVSEEDVDILINESAGKFKEFLDALLVDQDNDPNSMDTAKRVAKMYYRELMKGRYEARPKVTAFPNNNPDDRYVGMMNIRAELKSICSHHHQPVRGICYIGLLPSVHLIGLSKYARLAQWCARRGTLQEELARKIADEMMKATGTKDLGVFIQATHGCMENRGVCAHSSLTQTTVLHGQFYNPSVKDEWTRYIQLQQSACKE